MGRIYDTRNKEIVFEGDYMSPIETLMDFFENNHFNTEFYENMGEFFKWEWHDTLEELCNRLNCKDNLLDSNYYDKVLCINEDVFFISSFYEEDNGESLNNVLNKYFTDLRIYY